MQPEATSLFTPVQLAAFIGIAAFLLSIYVNILKARSLSRPSPDNQKLGDAVTRLTAISENHEAAISKLESSCASCRVLQSAEVGKVHNRVDEVASAVSRLDGKMDILLHKLTGRKG